MNLNFLTLKLGYIKESARGDILKFSTLNVFKIPTLSSGLFRFHLRPTSVNGSYYEPLTHIGS